VQRDGANNIPFTSSFSITPVDVSTKQTDVKEEEKSGMFKSN
jgi:mevalonate pyrophosphate decarboxylase